MTLITADIDIYTDNDLALEDVPAEFEATYQEADRSVGDPGGWSCEFLFFKFGALKITRDMLTEVLSRAYVERIEEHLAESLGEYQGYADLVAE